MAAVNTLTNVQVATNASVALITPLTGLSTLKVVSLPVWSPGKFVYVADSNGNAGTYPFGIGTTGPSTIIVGAG